MDERRAALLNGTHATSATLRRGEDQGEWGTTWTVYPELDAPVPGTGVELLAGKLVRRLKSLAETGEIPTTKHNPAYRGEGKDAGT